MSKWDKYFKEIDEALKTCKKHKMITIDSIGGVHAQHITTPDGQVIGRISSKNPGHIPGKRVVSPMFEMQSLGRMSRKKAKPPTHEEMNEIVKKLNSGRMNIGPAIVAYDGPQPTFIPPKPQVNKVPDGWKVVQAIDPADFRGIPNFVGAETEGKVDTKATMKHIIESWNFANRHMFCEHKPVDVGFNQTKMVCAHCNKDL